MPGHTDSTKPCQVFQVERFYRYCEKKSETSSKNYQAENSFALNSKQQKRQQCICHRREYCT